MASILICGIKECLNVVRSESFQLQVSMTGNPLILHHTHSMPEKHSQAGNPAYINYFNTLRATRTNTNYCNSEIIMAFASDGLDDSRA
jgi:hypothetical protein